MDQGTIAANLRRLRKVNDLTQDEVAEKAGLSRAGYRNIENRKSIPRASTLEALAEALEVGLQELVTPVPALQHVRFRSFKRLRTREGILADVARWLADFNELEEILGDRREYNLAGLERSPAPLKGSGKAPPEELAGEVRRRFGLGPREPVRDICGLLEQATLQTCLAHLLRRCHEMLQTATRGAVRFPRQVQAHLQHALALRDRRDAGEIGEHGLWVAKGRLQASLRRILRGNFTNPDNGRLARHLSRNEDALFVFLDHPGIEATNWPSEHAIRPAVVNRKSAGGSRSNRGAETQAVLMSLLRTAHQKDLDPRSLFTAILQAPTPAPQPLLLG